MKLILLFLFFFSTAMRQEKPTGIKKTIMAVFAHPDDEAVTNVSALLARYAREGHSVYLVIATKGELGTNKHAAIPAGDSLAKVRAGEAACASKALGIESPILLGLDDGSLAKGFTQEPVHKKLDSVFKKYQPDIIITWGPDGGYGHMDHRTVHTTVTDLFQSGDMPSTTKLYYTGMPTSMVKHWTENKTGKNWMYNHWNMVDDKYLTTKIKCSKEDMNKAVTALYCHWSQFKKEDMEETSRWMRTTNDTVYLRPFLPVAKNSYDLLP
ncbi:MAG TPA: PIG-L family deacetylase [Chitinophagaceae bacterium]|nr:PIG-L family deacetylase [Chitinophagaceae bacterium]